MDWFQWGIATNPVEIYQLQGSIAGGVLAAEMSLQPGGMTPSLQMMQQLQQLQAQGAPAIQLLQAPMGMGPGTQPVAGAVAAGE